MLLFNYSLATKTDKLDNTDVADVLGISAIIINDLKQKRKKDYNFSWESALQVYYTLLYYLNTIYSINLGKNNKFSFNIYYLF